jgi:signal transduction histidine kinase
MTTGSPSTLPLNLPLRAQEARSEQDERSLALASVALAFAESLDLTEVLDQVAQHVARLFGGVCRVRFTPAARPADKRRVVAGPNPTLRSRDGLGVDETYAALLARLSESSAEPNPQGHPDESASVPSEQSLTNGAALLFAPLIARGQRIGSLDVVIPAPNDFDVVHNQRLLRAVAAHAALAIDTADRYTQQQRGAAAEHLPSDYDPGPMLALIAHDLRSPLTALSASVQTLVRLTKSAQELDREHVARLARLAEAAIGQLGAQINALTPEPDQHLIGEPHLAQPVDLVKLTRLITNFYQQTTGRHKFIVVADIPELLAPLAHPDAERVLSNLLVNGIKYSPVGGEITVTLSREADALGQWAILSVRNCGIGIPPQDLPSLGQVGYRAGNVGPIPGTGFGLASVRAVVEQYGGTFAIQSIVGETTIVRIRLPLAM